MGFYDKPYSVDYLLLNLKIKQLFRLKIRYNINKKKFVSHTQMSSVVLDNFL